MIDALAYEPHFLDHILPVWRALPPGVRGRLLVDPHLEPRANAAGVAVEPVVPPKPAQRFRVPEPVHVPPHDGLALTASYGDIKKARRLGYRRFAFLEHGIGQSYAGDPRSSRHGSYAGGEDRDDVELFLMPNERSAHRWQTAYKAARVAVVGGPRLDGLPVRQISPLEQEQVVALSFHWECRLTSETRSALGHYLQALAPLAKRYVVLGHGHPRGISTLTRYYRRAGIEVVPDFADICRRADVYVCDNSSSLYEFAATGRPVVVLNAPWYRRSVDHGLRFWEAAGVGINVWSKDELQGAIDRALADQPDVAAERERALGIVYGFRSGAAARAVDALAAWAGVVAEAAVA